jgi:hypothetical protein
MGCASFEAHEFTILAEDPPREIVIGLEAHSGSSAGSCAR